MTDILTHRHSKWFVLVCTAAIPLLMPNVPARAAEITPLTPGVVRVDVEGVVGNDPPDRGYSITDAGQKNQARAEASAQGVTGCPRSCQTNFGSSRAAATLSTGIIAVEARAFNDATTTAVARMSDRLFFGSTNVEDPLGPWLDVVFTGNTKGSALLSNATVGISSSPDPEVSVLNGDAFVVGAGEVVLRGNATVEFRWPGLLEVAFSMALAAGATANDENRDAEVNFADTATIFLGLPRGYTFLGSESGLFLTARTDAIIGPGQPLPGAVPEPTPLALGAVGLAALAVRQLTHRFRRLVAERARG